MSFVFIFSLEFWDQFRCDAVSQTPALVYETNPLLFDNIIVSSFFIQLRSVKGLYATSQR